MTSPLFLPVRPAGLEVSNRNVISPMCQYNATDRSANDWHRMHLGQVSIGAAGL